VSTWSYTIVLRTNAFIANATLFLFFCARRRRSSGSLGRKAGHIDIVLDMNWTLRLGLFYLFIKFIKK
jgi:hypothetical protein